MKIAIVEDSQTDSLLLLDLLNKYMKKYDFTSEFDVFTSGEDLLKVAEPDVYDLCFMDIFMNGMNGIQTADRLRELDPSCFIIFLTSSPDFFADGFRLRAWRYLLKPVTMQQLSEALPECIEQVQLSSRRLTVSIGRKEICIPFSNICYVATANRSIEIHCRDTVLTTGKQITFSEVTAPLLKDYRFLTISKGQIVNLDYARTVEGNTLLMKNGEKLSISRNKLSEVSEALVRFHFEKY